MADLRRKDEPAAGDPTPPPSQAAAGSSGSGSDSDGSQEDTSYRAAFKAPGRPRKAGRGTGLVSDSDPDSDDAVFGEQMADYDAARSDDDDADNAVPDAEDSSVRAPRWARRQPTLWTVACGGGGACGASDTVCWPRRRVRTRRRRVR